MIDVNALLSSWFGLLFNYVSSLADYEIVEDVSFLGLLLAIGVFSIIVHIFFVKIIGFGSAPALSPKRDHVVRRR